MSALTEVAVFGSCEASEAVRRVDAGCLQETDSLRWTIPGILDLPRSHVLLGWHGRWLLPPSVFHFVLPPPHIECPQVAWTLSQEEPRCRCVGARRQRVDSGCWPAPRVTLTGDRRRLSSLSGSVMLVPTPKEASEPRNGATTSPETRTWTRLAVFCLRWKWVSNNSFRCKQYTQL